MSSSLAVVAFRILEWNCSSRLHLWEAGCWRASGEVDEFASMRDGFGNSDRNSWRAHRGI
jgi:hypothetical protein